MTSTPDPSRSPGDDATDDVAMALAGLDLEQRIRLLSGRDHWHLEPVPGVGLPAIMVTDGPHGLRKQAGTGDHLGLGESVPATCFPTAVGLGASWDVALLEQIGASLGRTCQAEDVAVLLGPGLNLKRHPAGGRNFEYLAEDPVLAGRLAGALVRGVQSQGVGACLKHLAANHQETFRMVVDTIVDQRTLHELELRAFEIALVEGRPWTVMTGYNQLNGTFCSDHRWLLTTWLRDTVGFDGLVMTDWGGMNDRVAATAAGCDLEMPGGGDAFDAELRAAVDAGQLTEGDLDACARRILELIVRARANRRPDTSVDHDTDHALARRAAAASTVLLTNDGILPLDPQAPGSIAVVGGFALQPRFQGAGSSQVRPTRLDAALPALHDRLRSDAADATPAVSYAPGYDVDTGTTTDALVMEAAEVAERADTVLLFVGLPGRYESEGFDRDHLELPSGHTRLVETVLDANPRTVVVLTNGAPVHLPWADRPAALVEAYLGGQAGGSAIVDVLLGDREPGGRLAESIPAEVTDLPADASFPGLPTQVEHREGLFVGYRFHDTAQVPARFPFGHGLGYTTIELHDVEVTGSGTDRTVHVSATNTGERAGSQVVQVYVRDVEASVPRPTKELATFAKVHLEPGATQRMSLRLDARAFAFHDPDRDGFVVEAGTFEVLVGTSSVELLEPVAVTVESGDGPTGAPAGRDEAPGTRDDGAPVPAAIPAIGSARHGRTVSVLPAPAVAAGRPAAVQPGPDEPIPFVASDETFAAMLGHPVPIPRPSIPFDRTSTVADLAATAAGRRLQALLIREATRRTDAATAADDDATRRMFEAVVREAPLRALPLLGGGQPSLAMIDRATATLNRLAGVPLNRSGR